MKVFHTDPDRYHTLRDGTVITRSRRGLLIGKGNDRLDLLHRLSTGDIVRLKVGEEKGTILTTEKGRIIDILHVMAFDDHIMIVLSGTDTERVIKWLDTYTIMDDFTVEDVTEKYHVIGLHGIRAGSIINSLFGQPIPQSGSFDVITLDENEVGYLLRGEGLNGPGSGSLVVKSEVVDTIIGELEGAGGILIDEETRQVMRIEAGVAEAGSEISDEVNPLEAGLVSMVSFTKGCYIGQEVISRLDSYDKIKRRLIGVRLSDFSETGEEIPQLTVRDLSNNEPIGEITSIAVSPTIGTIGLAFIRSAYATPDISVVVSEGNSGDQAGSGMISLLPFSLD